MARAISIIAPITSFNNRSVGDLVDELGSLKAEIAELEAREKTLRDELVARGAGEVDGDLYRATVSEAVRWTLDSAKVKAEMGERWWTARCRRALVTTVSVKAHAASRRAA